MEKLHSDERVNAQRQDGKDKSPSERDDRTPIHANLDCSAVGQLAGLKAKSIEAKLPDALQGQGNGAGESGVDDQTDRPDGIEVEHPVAHFGRQEGLISGDEPKEQPLHLGLIRPRCRSTAREPIRMK